VQRVIARQGFVSRRFSQPHLVIRQVEGNYKHALSIYSWSTTYTTLYIPLRRSARHLRHLRSLLNICETLAVTCSQVTAGGTQISVCPLRDYAKVSKSELTIDSRLLVPNPSRFDYNLPDGRAYKLSPKAYLNTPLIHFSSVWEAVACH